MAKLKLNLPTGLVVEKPIITCFEVESNKYLILDAENIGSMGLPIILVCKIDNNKVTKITDAQEWQKAKDYLKGIIAGNSMNYISLDSELAADEVYYTQLTLPVASFDVIKNAYKLEVVEEVPVVPVESVPAVEPVNPSINPEVSEIEPEKKPVIDIPLPSIPVVEEVPEVNTPVMPDIPNVPVADVVMPTVPEEPVIKEISTTTVDEEEASSMDFSETKEAFMRACENMVDALVEKFKSELNSKK